MNDNVMMSIWAVCLAAVICTLIVSCTFYNLRTNIVYAELIKAKDPLAVRCAWNGDQQVCQIVGLRH